MSTFPLASLYPSSQSSNHSFLRSSSHFAVHSRLYRLRGLSRLLRSLSPGCNDDLLTYYCFSRRPQFQGRPASRSSRFTAWTSRQSRLQTVDTSRPSKANIIHSKAPRPSSTSKRAGGQVPGGIEDSEQHMKGLRGCSVSTFFPFKSLYPFSQSFDHSFLLSFSYQAKYSLPSLSSPWPLPFSSLSLILTFYRPPSFAPWDLDAISFNHLSSRTSSRPLSLPPFASSRPSLSRLPLHSFALFRTTPALIRLRTCPTEPSWSLSSSQDALSFALTSLHLSAVAFAGILPILRCSLSSSHRFVLVLVALSHVLLPTFSPRISSPFAPGPFSLFFCAFQAIHSLTHLRTPPTNPSQSALVTSRCSMCLHAGITRSPPHPSESAIEGSLALSPALAHARSKAVGGNPGYYVCRPLDCG